MLALLLVLLPAGLWSKACRGPGHLWFNDYGGGVLYEIFWCVAAYGIWPYRKNIIRIVSTVFLISCIIELTQLWHGWPWLEAIRKTFTGRLLLGTTFAWWDFPHYALGCGLSWLFLYGIEGLATGKIEKSTL